jgi:nitroreductase
MSRVSVQLAEVVMSRVSTPRLVEPVPDPDTLAEVLAMARRAPDHGRLRPWRFYVLQGAALTELGDVFESAARESKPDLDDVQARRFREMPLRAPMIIVAGAALTSGHKVPAWEQLVAVGAAVQNLQLGLESAGFGCMWRTGEMAMAPRVLARFGLGPEDRIVGFLYVGTPQVRPERVADTADGRVFFGFPS